MNFRCRIRSRLPSRLRLVPGLLLALAAGCAGADEPRTDVARAAASDGEAASSFPHDLPPATVVLVSLDGTRPDDVTPGTMPRLSAFGRSGARAERLVPVNPTNTFPNHVSLATGVRPEVHRLVDNAFVDPVLGPFRRSAPHAWIEVEPIWSIAERHGLPTASFFWVGSEGPWGADRQGPGPRETRTPFSSRTDEAEKVDRILEWLSRTDRTRRPRLVTSWFHGADHAGHEDGPGSPAVVRDLSRQDAEIGRLIDGLRARDGSEETTLLFVSDHGMAAARRRVNLGRAMARAGLEVSVRGIGGFAKVYFDEGERTPETVERAVRVAREAGLEAWPRTGAPDDWHVDDPRFGDVVVRAPIGTAIVGAMTFIDGFHGYPADHPAMAGILIAGGRGVRAGAGLGAVSSLAIAPTVLALLGLPVPERMEAPAIPELLVGLDPARPGDAGSGRGAAGSVRGAGERTRGEAEERSGRGAGERTGGTADAGS